MCSRVHQSADPFVVRNLIEKPDALPSQELLVFRKSPSGEIVEGYLRWGPVPQARSSLTAKRPFIRKQHLVADNE